MSGNFERLVIYGAPQEAQLLFEREGGSINSYQKMISHPFCWKSLSFIQWLDTKGYDFLAREEEKPILFEAVQQGARPEIIAFLREKGANLYRRYCGQNLFHWATLYGKYRTMKYLSSFFPVDEKDDCENTALHLLCKECQASEGQCECRKCMRKAFFLLENGADVNTIDDDGDSPYISACRNGSLKMILLLQDYNVDGNFADKYGDSPVKIYYEGNHPHPIIL